MEDGELDEAAFQAATDDLGRTMQEMGKMARKRGLTDEKLDAILNVPKT